MSGKWNMIVDVGRCNNCASCTLAVMDEHAGNDFPGYAAPQPGSGAAWIQISRKTRGEGEHIDVAYMPAMCNHCDNPPCAEDAGGAVVKRDDGIVLIDPVRARGRRDIVAKCPYGAINWNEELQLPQIWIFDAHLLDAGWPFPRCQHVCPTGAYRAIKVSDVEMQALARQQGLEVLRPELGTAPRVYYRNLHRVMKRFIAGTVHAVRHGIRDCLQGCAVSLQREGVEVARAISDCFGDFRLDGLPDETLLYELVLEHGGQQVRVPVESDVAGKSLGAIALAIPHPDDNVSM
ncbi:MAG TPA: 4Fe-4S dicluster domain-containing protein [Steroidobacteraceae bacterium]|nr:4Fe-4S dicluster domain-containing protein [Steroidobacteraceae bacterium]